MYNSRVKNRRLKLFFVKLSNLTKFKTSNFCINKKIILLALIIGYISLFLTWIKISENDGINILNSFNKINIFNSSLILILLTIILFVLFSSNKKEKIKLLTHIQIKDSNLLIFLNLLVVLLSISSLSTIIGLKMFYLNINYGNGVIFTIISGIIGFFGSIKLKNSKNNKIIINESYDNNRNNNNNNMKLPI